MSIDTASFTPLSALAGGALIGIAAAWILLANGRIAGISSMLGDLVPERSSGTRRFPAGAGVSMLFLAGLILAPLLFRLAGWSGVPGQVASPAALALAGLLVGYGTRLGNGCTSGHGVCGIARLSPRSLLATALFMASAMIVVWLQRVLS